MANYDSEQPWHACLNTPTLQHSEALALFLESVDRAAQHTVSNDLQVGICPADVRHERFFVSWGDANQALGLGLALPIANGKPVEFGQRLFRVARG